MTIILDKANHRATDDTSGMTVAYIRSDLPLERGEFWMLAWKSKEHAFRVSWADGFQIISRERGDLSFDETVKRANELNQREYRIPMVESVDKQDFLDHIDVFIELFSTVARKRIYGTNIHVIFQPWAIPEKYHRDIQFPAVDADDAAHEGGKPS